MLWPVGRISVNGYSPLSQLLHSAANGVRDASSSTKIMIHLANGWNAGAVSSFFNQIFISGQLATTDIDVLGFSFYPFYGTGATYAALKSSLQAMVTKYNKVCSIFLELYVTHANQRYLRTSWSSKRIGQPSALVSR